MVKSSEVLMRCIVCTIKIGLSKGLKIYYVDAQGGTYMVIFKMCMIFKSSPHNVDAIRIDAQ